jgi:aminoglycoside phosphotransferase (APT) family kinase protein
MTQGLDLAALATWLDARHPGLRRGELRAGLIEGGRSNLTFWLDDDEHAWVLRRPPLGHVLATAHDMGREFRVIGALHGSAVPVPKPVLHHPDADVLGAPFYLMDRVEGLVLRGRAELGRVPPAERAGLANRLVDTLARLHAVDPAAVGLADFGRPEGFLTRQLARWSRQLAASRSREVAGIEALQHALTSALPAGVPRGGPAAGAGPGGTVVHGDYRLDNLLVRADTWDVAAVLDWEMTTLGDPLTDLGLLIVYWGNGSAAQPPGTRPTARGLAAVAEPPSGLPGFGSGQDLADRYADRTGTDLTPLPWYVSFGYFKLAVILEGIHFRYRQGLTVGAGFDRVGTVVPDLVAAGHESLRRMR